VALERTKVLQPGSNFLLGIFANRAGIDHDHIGPFEFIGDAIAHVGHDRSHNFAVRKIHLTAVAFQIKVFFGNTCCGFEYA